MAQPSPPGIPESTSAFFTDLGRRIEARWAASDRDEEAFPAIAAEELARVHPAHHLDPAVLIRDLLDPLAPASRQLAPVGAFGQPGFTLHYGRGFVIDVYFWNNAVPAIHNHPFAGVFTILKGLSLHRTYGFEVEESLGARVRLGRMEDRELTLLREGDMVSFSRHEHALVHSLIHVPNPSISLVVRTIRALEYFRYFPPSIALAMSDPDDWTTRQLALLDMIRNAGDLGYEAAMGRFLAGSDFETAFRAASSAYGHFRSGNRIPDLAAMVREHHGTRADLIIPAIEGAMRLQQDNAFRERFTGDGDRFVASVLMCARNRDDVLRLLGEGFEGDAPATALGTWARKVGIFAPEDDISVATLDRLMTGESLPAILKAMREQDPAHWETLDPASIEAGWRESPFRSLLS